MPGKWTPAERTPGPCHSSDPLLLFLSYVSIALKLKLIGTRPKKQPVWRAEEYGNSRFWMWAKQQWRYHSAKASSRTRTERPREGLWLLFPSLCLWVPWPHFRIPLDRPCCRQFLQQPKTQIKGKTVFWGAQMLLLYLMLLFYNSWHLFKIQIT